MGADFSTLTANDKPAYLVSGLNKHMPELKDRIEELLAAKGWDQAALAAEAKVTQSAVSQWLGHGSKVIKSIGSLEAALRLEKATGYSALWIATGKGPKLREQPAAHGTTLVPLVAGEREPRKYLQTPPWPFKNIRPSEWPAPGHPLHDALEASARQTLDLWNSAAGHQDASSTGTA